jgi:small subunit ribosomal protein S1
MTENTQEAAPVHISPENAQIIAESEGYLTEVDGQIVPNYDLTINIFGEGDIVTGTVVRIDKDEVLVDIGYKSEGVIPVSELSIRKSVNTSDEVQLGEEIDALVMQKEDADGRLILSKKRARFEKAWKRIEEAHESGVPVQGTVIEVVKGGLILDLGVRGFLPASLVDIRRVQDLSEYVGQELSCRVIEMNRNRNNVVLSRRAVLEEERKEVRQQIIDELNVGDIVTGTISNIVDFGAFVDLDGIDGLIHISELSWTHINHPSEVLQVNQEVKVKVLDIDRDRQRISLGLKQTQEDPWQKIVAEHRIGDVVQGRVTKIVAFGAFVEIYEGIEGLVHISELANRHVERPDEVVSVSQQVQVKVIEIDSDRRRLSLSIKRVEGQQVEPLYKPEPEATDDDEAVVGEVLEEALEEEAVAEEIAEVVAEDVVVEAIEEAVEEVVAEAVAETVAEVAEADTPTLGLSDEVFPAGGRGSAEAKDDDEAKADDETKDDDSPSEA